jgi:hypothetical protein
MRSGLQDWHKLPVFDQESMGRGQKDHFTHSLSVHADLEADIKKV